SRRVGADLHRAEGRVHHAQRIRRHERVFLNPRAAGATGGSVSPILPPGRRLVVVSNREPFEVKARRLVPTVGGLVAALDPVMRASRGLWIAWKRGEEGERPQTVADPGSGAPYTLQVIPVSEREAGGYYD